MFTIFRKSATTGNDNKQGLTLSDTRVGHKYILIKFEAGRQLRERISSMGLNSGSHLTIISNSGHGPVGLEVKRTRLGIGRSMAQKIRVKEIAI